MILLSECTRMIQAEYPNPVQYDAYTHGEDQYCVAGAMLRHLSGDRPDHVEEINFPMDDITIASGIRVINPSCPKQFALMMARQIPPCNDTGHFNAAWGFLDMSLSYRPALTHQKE